MATPRNRQLMGEAGSGEREAGIFDLGPFTPGVFLPLPGHKAEAVLTIVLCDVQSNKKHISGR
jgi:hypothetical protein